MTPTLSSLLPLSRLAVLRRAPFWAQALALCALFAIVGVAVLDDYGVAGDETHQRKVANANADYIVTGGADGLYERDLRYFGVAFEMPLLLIERALGLQNSRHIFITRHLLTHLFFIAGGFACGMLAYRMLGNGWIALPAMLMFLLHPRLYAHSFFNSKDIPFAALLIIALYLAHRAFRKDTLGAFLLCGIGVGLAINLRPSALMLMPMILAMRGLDLWQAGRGERKRILASAGIFAAAALATTYIIHPYYWENPLRFIETIAALSQHTVYIGNLFMGEIHSSYAAPWNYIPVWFAITAPLVTLALGVIGCAAVCWWAITRPLATLRDRETRFRIMLIGCVAMPVAIAIILQSTIYNGWRHMYFLWGPFCLLAVVGLHTITNIHIGMGIWKFTSSLPLWARGGGRLRIGRQTLAYGAAGFGLITTATAMAALHPHQQVYFNALVDTNTLGAPGNRYDMDYWLLADRKLLERLLDLYPDDTLRVWKETPTSASELILPSSDRERIVLTRREDADFHFHRGVYRRHGLPADPLMFHSIQAYGSAIAYISAPNSDAYRGYYRAAYADADANGTLLARADFDVYIHNGELRYLSADCEPLADNYADWVFLHIFPADLADLSTDRREYGFENRDFRIDAHAAYFDDKCIIKQILPDYPIARIRTGQNAKASGAADWRADIDFAAHAAAQAVYDRIIVGDYGKPVAQSRFALYLSGNSLAYIKEPCAADDADAQFFLHIIPDDPADLPADRREAGFANMDFQFAGHGAYLGNKCVAERDLPGYTIERIRTGQFVSGEGRVWGAEFAAGR